MSDVLSVKELLDKSLLARAALPDPLDGDVLDIQKSHEALRAKLDIAVKQLKADKEGFRFCSETHSDSYMSHGIKYMLEIDETLAQIQVGVPEK